MRGVLHLGKKVCCYLESKTMVWSFMASVSKGIVESLGQQLSLLKRLSL